MPIDFEQARKRLDAGRQRLETGLDPVAKRALLEERARRVAARNRLTSEREARADVVAVRRGEELWGLPVAAVMEVRRLPLCVLPGLHGAVQGLVQVRGAAVSVLDLAALSGVLSPPAHGEEQLAVVVTGKQGAVALRVDEVLGQRAVWSDECGGEAERAQRYDFVTAVTRDLVALIDVERLLSRPEVTPARQNGA